MVGRARNSGDFVVVIPRNSRDENLQLSLFRPASLNQKSHGRDLYRAQDRVTTRCHAQANAGAE